MTGNVRQLTLAGALGLMLAGCVAGGSQQRVEATVTSSGGPSIQQAQQERYDGPKARIAVNQFTNKAAQGGRQIGTGMSDMLTTALFHSNRFIVLDRQDHGAVMGEQDLAASGRIREGTGAPIGQMEGAELLVTGSITSFDPNASGAVGGVGLPFGAGGVGIGGGTRNAHIAIDIKVVDTKTGRIVSATTVEGKATDAFGGAGIFVGPIGAGLAGYENTPMEKAVRVCIQKAVDYIASQTPARYYH